LKTAQVCAVVLNWNRREDTLACIASLLQSSYEPLRVLVCDNGSTDDTPTAVRTVFPNVEVLELGRNLGFAAGMNAGIRHALATGAEQVLLLNNDTIVDQLMVERLVAHTTGDVGLIAPLIFYASQPDLIWSAGGLSSRWTLEQKHTLRGQRDRADWPVIIERDFVPGCAMLLPRSALESVGLFDERFFMYYEDSDLCLRLRRAGFRVLLVPDARMWHKVAISSGGADSPGERFGMAKGSVLFFRKHVHGWRWFIIVPFRLGSACKTTIRLLRYRKMVAARAYWRGLFKGIQVNS
jgi:GT2 family glycosyltransferase